MNEYRPEPDQLDDRTAERTGAAQDEELFPNPYVGPQPLTNEEAARFGGRDDEIEQLLDKLVAKRIVLLHAPSGAGKTSLIDAGLRNRLVEDEDFWVSPMLRVNGLPNNLAVLNRADGRVNRFIFSLLMSLEKAWPKDSHLTHAELAELSLSEYLDQRLPEEAQRKDIVLVFDQFEEILTIDEYDAATKRDFFAEIGQVLIDSTRFALFSARADYLYGFERYARAVPTGFKHRFELRLLERKAAIEAIQAPAAAVHRSGSWAEKPKCKECISFDADAADYVVENLLQETPFVEPVLLQVVCQDLWNKLRAKPELLQDGDINLKDAESMTDVDVALELYYCNAVEQIAKLLARTHGRRDQPADGRPAGRSATDLARIEKDMERRVREWIDKLIENDIRTQVQVDSQSADEGDVTLEIARELERVYLVRKDERRGILWYELSHDRLVRPIVEDNQRWLASLDEVPRRAKLWADAKENKDFLFDNIEGDLDRAQAWADEQERPPDQVKAFLKASWEEENKRLAEIKLNRRVRILAVASAVIAVVAIVLTIIVALNSAENQRRANLSENNDLCEREQNAEACREAMDLAIKRGPREEQIARACLNGLLFEEELELEDPLKICETALIMASGAHEEAEIVDGDIASFNDQTSLIDPDEADLGVLNDLCSFALQSNLGSPLLSNACTSAAVIASTVKEVSELDQVNIACQNGLNSDLASEQTEEGKAKFIEYVMNACQTAAGLAARKEVQSLAQMNIACQNAIRANLDQDLSVEPCRHAVEVGAREATVDLSQRNLACQNGLIANLPLPEVQPVCGQAALRARVSDNLVQVNQACSNALNADLTPEALRPACIQAAILASDQSSQDLVQANQACGNALNAGLTPEEVRPACGQAASVASYESSQDLVQVNIACENALILGEKGYPEGLGRSADTVDENLRTACTQAAGLAEGSETDLGQVTLACRNSLDAGIEISVAARACGKAVEIAAESIPEGRRYSFQGNFILLNQACQDGLEAGIADDDSDVSRRDALLRICQRAVILSVVSTNLTQVKSACQNTFDPDLRGSVNGQAACGRLEVLVILENDLEIASSLCKDNASEPWASHPVRAACPLTVRLASAQGDLPELEYQCRNGDDPRLVQQACAQALELASVEENLTVLDYVCRNGTTRELVEEACGRALELARTQDDLPVLNYLCRSGNDGELVQQACLHVLELASAQEDLPVVDYVCRNGTDQELVREACEEAGSLVSEQPNYLSNLCFHSLKANPGLEELPVVCQDALKAADAGKIRTAANLCLIPSRVFAATSQRLALDTAKDLGEACSVIRGREAALDAGTRSASAAEGILGPDSAVSGNLKPGAVDAWIFETGDLDTFARISLVRSGDDLEEGGELTPVLTLYSISEDSEGEITVNWRDGSVAGEDEDAALISQILPAQTDFVILASGNAESGGRYDLAMEMIEARVLTPDSPESGEVAPGESDRWLFEGTAGQFVDIAMDRNPDERDFDPYLQLRDIDYYLLAENDNSNDSSNAEIDQVMLPEDGVYLIEASGYGDGGGSYRLTLSIATIAELVNNMTDAFQALELCQTVWNTGDPDDVGLVCDKAVALAMSQANEIDEPGQFSGALESGQAALYTFTGVTGQVVDIRMDQQTESDIDPLLTLYDSDGILIATDDDGGGDLNAWIREFTLPADSTYFIVARDLRQGSGRFTLAFNLGSFAELVAETTDAAQALEYCRSAIEQGESGDIELACNKAAELAIDSGNAQAGLQFCQLEGVDNPDTLTLIERACSLAATQAGPIAAGETTDVLEAGVASYWLFENEGEEGQILVLTMDRAQDSAIDPFLSIYDLNGTLIAQNDDGGGDLNALVDDLILMSGASYLIEASSLGDAGGAYTLDLQFEPLEQRVEEALGREDPVELNGLCWLGSLAGWAEIVLPACERAVELAEESGAWFLPNVRDSRGLALALTGEYERAIEDFQFYVDETSDEYQRAQRIEWIGWLRAGTFALDDALREELRLQ